MQINLEHVSVVLNNHKLLDDISLFIDRNQQWAIIGESGSGKTTLAKSICKLIFHHGEINFNHTNSDHLHIFFVEQQHQFKNKQNIQQFYHQQRFNSFDTEQTLTVEEILGNSNDKEYWVKFFGLELLLKKPMIQLSNGENKRLQLTNAMLQNPQVVVLDNPFVGLDIAGRMQLQSALNQLSQIGKKLILICTPKDIPQCITHIALLNKGKLITSGPKKTLLDQIQFEQPTSGASLKSSIIKLYQSKFNNFTTAVELINVTIQYNQQPILSDINWKIKNGEKWCVAGPNGSGKSTLLSLITADNPQAFANQIWLFDKRKGSGESIWDIKKKIGHVSPELHLFFDKGIEVRDVVASGLFDTIGLFRKLSTEDEAIIDDWMNATGIHHFKNKWLHQLSLGEQRLVILTRALVKSPALLILDEPYQGLDHNQTQLFKQILEVICSIKNVTLIYVSHYLEDIPSQINNFLRIEKGRILKNGT
jgi:molybdate transport system ATP-binding protein